MKNGNYDSHRNAANYQRCRQVGVGSDIQFQVDHRNFTEEVCAQAFTATSKNDVSKLLYSLVGKLVGESTPSSAKRAKTTELCQPWR